jgi:DNA repair protein RecO (recombination protein O)
VATDKTKAIVIRAVDFSETSKVVTLYTRDLGKISVLAKGSRRLKSSFEVALDLLSVCDICVIRKPSAELDLLTEAVLDERFAGVRTDLRALYASYFIAEVLDGLTQRGDPHPTLFFACLEALRLLDGGKDRFLALGWFVMQLQKELGYAPNLEECASCGGEVKLSQRTGFGIQAGGLLCQECARFQGNTLSVRGGTIQVLRTLLRERPDRLERLTVSKVDRAESWRLMTASLYALLGRKPRTADLVEV